MALSIEEAVGLARILKEEMRSFRVMQEALEARLSGLETINAENVELKRQIDELKKQLDASRKSTVVNLRAAGGGA
jgi:cell division protein FtsB